MFSACSEVIIDMGNEEQKSFQILESQGVKMALAAVRMGVVAPGHSNVKH